MKQIDELNKYNKNNFLNDYYCFIIDVLFQIILIKVYIYEIIKFVNLNSK